VLSRLSAKPASPVPRNPDQPRPEGATRRLIQEAEVLALRRAGLARVVAAGLLLLVIVIASDGLRIGNPLARHQVAAASLTLVLLGLAGWSESWLASRRLAIQTLPVVAATIDAALILGNILYGHWVLDIPGSLFASFPITWMVPITMAATAIYYRPRLQIYVAGLYAAGFLGLIFTGDTLTAGERRADLSELAGLFGQEANTVRVIMIVSAALILVVVAQQGRLLLERAVRETTTRLNLTRYLPGELAPILTEQALGSLRTGRRVRVTLLFVDMRASTTFGETMDPSRLAVFITAFRRRVMRAAAQHGGMIDKFTGDGALILFGVPTENPGDARRAIACGRMLLVLIARWNDKRGFDPPVRIGIGIHTGEVFCGVVGDEKRLEFTVLGETVNTGARIEQATKAVDVSMLASRETVAEAGEEENWVEVEDVGLPGVTRSVCVMRPLASPERP
jgi:adenylate cyclase